MGKNKKKGRRKRKGVKEEEEKVEEVEKNDVTGLDVGDEKREADEEDSPDIRQSGSNENGGDGGVARRQGPEDPEHREWK